jgi:cytochrome b6-f complex iron-sulfur subunit
MDTLEGSSFEDVSAPVVAGGEGDGIGLTALWQRCVHLGCRVPSCESSQGFECPCHGSKYNRHGEYEAGPAPRNLDRFAVAVNAAGELIVDTGEIVETSRSKNKTVQYPQGPFCV